MHQATVGERIAGAYGRAIVLLRFVVPLAWVAAAVLAWIALPPLGGSSSAPLGDIVATDSKAIAAQQRAVEQFGSTVGTDTAVVQRNPRGLTEREVQSHVAAARARRQPGVYAALPVVNAAFPGVRWREERTTVVTYLFLDPSLNLEERDEAARAYAQRLVTAPGSSVGVTGAAPARLTQFAEIDEALPLVTAATLFVIVLIVALYFRSLGAPLLTLITAGIAYVVAVRALAWVGERAGVSTPSEIEPVLVVLLLGLVTDYTVFFMAEARRRLARGEPRVPAAQLATARIAPIVLTAGVIVAGGAASLLAGEMDFFRVFGPGLALCALLVTLVCVTFVPAVLGLLGPRLFGRKVREAKPAEHVAPGAVVMATPSTDPDTKEHRRERRRLRFSGSLGAVRASRRHASTEGGSVASALGARMLATKPVAFVLVALCVGGLAFAAARGGSADLAVSYIPSLPEGTEARSAAENAARGFGPGILAPAEVVVEAPRVAQDLPGLVDLQALIAEQPGVDEVVGPRQPARTPFEGAVIAEGGDAARYAIVLDSEPTSPRAMADLERLQERMPALLREAGLPRDARVSYGGETALGVETIDLLEADLRRVAVATLVVTFVLLALFLQALVAPLLLLFGSVLAFVASFGLTTLLLPDALGGTDFVFYVPLVAGVLLIGLGSDYNVFIAGRIREETRRRRLREAIAVAAPSASRAITVAGITLAATFALLALVPLRPFRELALLMTIGVLVDALLVRPVLIPALIALFGRVSWWPGRPQRPPRTSAFLERVAERSGLAVPDADVVTRATLTTLGERIPSREQREVAAQLPDPLARALRTGDAACEPFGCEEFVARVATRAATSHAAARDYARAVIATLAEALPPSEIDYVRAALSEDYRGLFGDAVDPGRDERLTERIAPSRA